MSERKSKKFWYADEFGARQVTAYECPPNDDIWWVPEVGYSVTEKHHLFSTKTEAAIAELKRKEKELTRLEAVVKLLRKEAGL